MGIPDPYLVGPDIVRNLRLAFRTLFKSPFVTVVAILSLALGIGANAAIFSMFDQIVLAPLPVFESHRLANLSAPGPKYGSQSCNQAGGCDVVFSYPMYRDLEREQNAFESIAAHRLFGANIGYQGETMNGEGMLVSGSYFPTLRLQPALGRLFTIDDDVVIGGHSIAVLDNTYWRTRLGSDPSVIGQTIMVNGSPLEIIGVAPAGFRGTTFGGRPSVYVPLTMRARMSPGWEGFENRRSYWIYVFGRLQPNGSLEQTSQAINATYRPIIQDVELALQEGMTEATLARFAEKQILVEDGRRGQSSAHREARAPLMMLFATTGIVLLIACANIANLLLARGANRAMEMAVRLSLGANRRQVITQLLTESVVLALLGGMASLVVARWTLAAITALLPPEASQMLSLDLRVSVVLFAAALSIATGLLFGLFPALYSTRQELVTTIRANAGNLSATRSATRFRTSLVTAQIALSLALLVAAGLFLKSLANIRAVDLGIDVDDVITFSISPQLNGYEAERSRLLFEDVEDRLSAIPGVTAVTSSMVPLLGGSSWGTDVRVQDFESGPGIDSNSRYNEIGAGYFATVGIQLLAGREFTRADNENGMNVAVVNEEFVRKFNLGSGAVGKHMGLSGTDEGLNIEIVGVVRNAGYDDVKDPIPPLFFLPWRQDEDTGFLTFYVSSPLPAAQIMNEIHSVMRDVDSNLPVEELKTMPQQIRENVFLDRMIGMMSATFAGLATLLAAIGLYGVLAYTVATRTREIGVRIALGANSGSVLRMVLGQVMRMLAIGGVIGLIGAYFVGKAATAILFQMQGTDPFVFAAAAGVLTLFALAAGYLPARRAAGVDPMNALRYE